MKKISLFQFVILIGLPIVLLGCASNSNSITSIPATTTGMSLMENPTDTPTPISTLTNAQPSTAMPSNQPKPLPTQGDLSDEEYIYQLLQTNGGCELPCWLGIVPGETHWDEAERFLSSLSLGIDLIKDETTTEVNGISIRRREFHIYVDTGDATTYRFRLLTRDNLVTGIRVSSPLTNYHFLLKDLLSNQGVPDKIFIFTRSNVMEPPTPFNLILFYQEQRFLAAYSTLVYKENEQITACLDDVGPGLIIFPEKNDLSDQLIAEIFIGPDPIGVLSVDDALGMSPADFYETYRNSETSCLITPADIWP